MHELPLTINKDIIKNYKDLNSLIEDRGINSELAFIIKTNESEIYIDEYMPFYFNGEKFINNVKYRYLPLNEFERYELLNCELYCTDAGGKGGGDFIDVITIIKAAIDTLNNYVSEKPFSYALYLFAIKSIIRAIDELMKRFNFVEHVKLVLHFTKRNKIKLKAENFVEDYEDLSKKEIKEIDKGLKIIQKLNNDGLLEKTIDALEKDETIRFERIYKKKYEKTCNQENEIDNTRG